MSPDEPAFDYFSDPIATGDEVNASWETQNVHLVQASDEGVIDPYGEAVAA